MMAAATTLEGTHSPSKELTVSPSSAAQTRRGASATNSTPLHDSAALRSASTTSTTNSTPYEEQGVLSPAALTRRGAASAGINSSLTPLHDSTVQSELGALNNMATPQHSPVSTPTGTKLAVSTPSESPAGGEGVDFSHDEEKEIALTQLRELEVAIEVRKVTKVDGRKVRWIEYRARKKAEEEEKQLALSSSGGKKRTRRSKARSKGENSENDANVVNNNNNNKSETTMKVESPGSPLSVVGTSNVLESMKQQFLQGTDAISNGKTNILTEATVKTQRRKSGRTRKQMSTPEVGSPVSTSPVKVEGVPAGNDSVNPLDTDPLALTIKKSFYSPRSLTKGLREVRKSENGTDGTPIKTENGDSAATSPTTTSLPLIGSEENETKPSIEVLAECLAAVKDTGTTETKSTGKKNADNKDIKPPLSLVKTAARLLSPPTARSKSVESGKGKKGAAQKRNTKKATTKAGRSHSEPRKTVNGFSEGLQNGSPTGANTSSLSETFDTPVSSQGEAIKRRGRAAKRKQVTKKVPNTSGKSGKKVAMVVADVHNTMNGEPQMGIPVSRPILRGKKKSPTKKQASSSVLETIDGDGKDVSPAPKRQKVTKNKGDEDVVMVASDVTETKKGKGSGKKKKKKDEPEVVDLENDNTSASTLNQTQVSSEKSTKTAKSVQKLTQKQVPTISSDNDNSSTASSKPPTKKKSSPKTTKASKAKTKPNQIKISEMFKPAVPKAAGSPKGKGKGAKQITKSNQKDLKAQKEVPKSLENSSVSQVGESGEPKGSLKATPEEKDPLAEEDIRLDKSSPQNPETIPKDPLALNGESEELRLVRIVEERKNKQADVIMIDSTLEGGLLPTDTALNSVDAGLTETEKRVADLNEARAGLEGNSVLEGNTTRVSYDLETSAEMMAKEETISAGSFNLLGVRDNNNIPEPGTIIPTSEAEFHLQNNNDPLLKDKVLTQNHPVVNELESDTINAKESVIEECKSEKESEELSPRKDSLDIEKVSQVCQVESEKDIGLDLEILANIKESPGKIKDSPSSVKDQTRSDTESESVGKSSASGRSLMGENRLLVLKESPNKKDDMAGKLTVYDFPSPERVSPNKDLVLGTSGQNSSAKETSVVENSETPCLQTNNSSSSPTKASKVTDICRPDSNLTHWSTKDVEITVVKSSPPSPPKVLKSPKKEYGSPVSITASETMHYERREAAMMRKKDQATPLLEGEIINSKSDDVSDGKESDLMTSNAMEPLEVSVVAPTSENPVATKSKDKVPRFLKQLFQDEGVQNMLKSMNEDSSTTQEISPNSDSSTHKLRPKRATEPMLSSSPDLDMEVFLSSVSNKKKKRGSEVDTLYMDEGVLNLLTSIDPHSRRGVSESSSENRKRKMSGTNPVSNSAKLMQQPETKRIRIDEQEVPQSQDPYELTSAEEFKEREPSGENTAPSEPSELVVPKKGRPVMPLSVKQKKGIRIPWKIKKPKQLKTVVDENQEAKEDENSGQLQEALWKAKEAFSGDMPLQVSNVENENSKSVPPLKIRLASDSVTIKPIARTTTVEPEITEIAVLPKPAKPVQEVFKPAVNDPSRTEARPSSTPPEARVSSARPPIDKPRVIHSEQYTSSQQLKTSQHFIVQQLPPPPQPAPQQRRIETLTTATHPGFPSLVRGLDLGAQSKSRQRMGGESIRQSQRASVRQSEGNYHFRDISLRKFNNFTQIILSPSTTKMKNALNSRVLRELCEALNVLRRDESVKMVLLTGTGSTFCQGVDLTALQHPNIETRKKNAENLVRGIKEFLKALVTFPKPLIAGVNGNAMGLGVTMLPLFDSVFANDKAEFYLPYATLGQVPEGGATYTFPNLFGKLQSTKLFQGHKLTAAMATQLGLASETLWPATFQEQLIPKVALLATNCLQSMEATKALMNHHLITKLELSLESECQVLLQNWMSPTFPHYCKKFLESNYIHFQKPVSLPL